ncbi:unnamed protein product [Bursaphelenchus okinawaensis]|uniref:Rad4 beta-hairpin domain-containing protein n=1 Tax=Bursaphelenchus okinawaensis TaxID=465554 RepID=A0A811LLV4_9BILA|nr:unnamed protein product [Bursaphelenchus okinawaensis]CAG9126127.1 unnamed protein product [Bursaphelenchus okinawaensis]
MSDEEMENYAPRRSARLKGSLKRPPPVKTVKQSGPKAKKNKNKQVLKEKPKKVESEKESEDEKDDDYEDMSESSDESLSDSEDPDFSSNDEKDNKKNAKTASIKQNTVKTEKETKGRRSTNFQVSMPQSSKRSRRKAAEDREENKPKEINVDIEMREEHADIEPDLPELEAPMLWTEVLQQKPGTSKTTADDVMDDSGTDEDSEEEHWHAIEEEKKPEKVVQVTLKKEDLERKEEKMLRAEIEKILRDRKDEVSKMVVFGMAAHLNYQMKTLMEAVRDPNWKPDWSTALEEKVVFGGLNDDTLKEFKEELTLLDDAIKILLPKIKYQWMYVDKKYHSNLDLCMMVASFLIRSKLDIRIGIAFDVTLVPPLRVSKKGKSSYLGPFYFVEYWCDTEKKFVCINLESMEIGKVTELESTWKSKCHYVFTIDQRMKMKDMSSIYCSEFLKLVFRKERHLPEVILDVLDHFKVPDSPRDLEEDQRIKRELLALPMPTVVAEFKNHPLYALEKDFLKFEAVYPADTKPVGEVRGHNVYPREAVHVLQGELNWIRLARQIKEGEKPYKVVKARPKLSIPADERVQLYLDTYGYWQTEPYVPPKVINGRIPRNEYGNVYMYQKSMVPQECVHIKLSGVSNIARQLGVDAAPAVTGWEFSGGRNHPLVEGCVIMKQHEKAIRAAWSEWNQMKQQKKIQKAEDKMITLWRRFVRGKLLLENMRKKYKIQ